MCLFQTRGSLLAFERRVGQALKLLASLPLNEKDIMLSEEALFTSIGKILLCASLTISNPQSSRTSQIVFRKVNDRSLFNLKQADFPAEELGIARDEQDHTKV
jgi:hypothetical protein